MRATQAEQTSSAPIRALQDAIQGRELELAVVVPTFNERANIPVLLARLDSALAGICYEVIVVDDDSPDGTCEAVQEIALRHRHVRCLRRIGRRGLASACLEGMMSTSAPYIAVMDGDLQHDESILPRMLARASSECLDVVVASRNIPGASMGEFSEGRTRLSGLGSRLSRLILNTEVHDPMSGFFLAGRRFLEETIYRTSGVGFKILVDLLASAKRPVRLAEVPYTFRLREAGESKLDLTVSLEYLYLLLDKWIGRYVPLRFALYALVGAAGVVLHLGTLELLRRTGSWTFGTSQIAATYTTMTFNFLLNNVITHRDARLRGARLAAGLASFCAACSVGAVVNLSVAQQLLARGFPWIAAGFGGLVLSSVWNYGVTSVFTWRRTRAKSP
jgi:dolichol-phosphate mannosyltransferase